MSTVSLSRLAYERLRGMFLDNRFSAGMKISETQLAKELGISRTPLREAIRQLQSEGLLYQVAHSGTYISMPGRREISEIYDVRQALEALAIQRAAPRLKHEELERLAQLYQEMHEHVVQFHSEGASVMEGERLRRFLAADLAFHMVIFEAADNRTAIKIYSDVQMRNRAFGDQSHRRDQRHLNSVLHSHASILQALQRHDVEAATRHMAEHIENSRRDALDTFDRMPAPPELDEDQGDRVVTRRVSEAG